MSSSHNGVVFLKYLTVKILWRYGQSSALCPMSR